MFCKHCGNQLDENATICMNCGCPVTQKKDSLAPLEKEKNHTTAGLLAIFLGGLGVHKFYLGNIVLGIVFLLFCWTGVPIVVGIVEGILYLECPQNQFVERYGYKKGKNNNGNS